jgi:hypothetical protein
VQTVEYGIEDQSSGGQKLSPKPVFGHCLWEQEKCNQCANERKKAGKGRRESQRSV